MMTRIRTMLRRDEGASAVEYGLLVAAIAAVIVVAVFALGTVVNNSFVDTEACIANAGAPC
jgi:pilus assembly protein Flp/PilA